jgi:hypothetical protein
MSDRALAVVKAYPCPEIAQAVAAYDKAKTRREALRALGCLALLKYVFEAGRRSA